MRKILDQIDLNNQYLKAKAAFEYCIGNENNEFLNGEIDIPVNAIIIKNESVKITFSGNNKNQYTVETLLLLFTPDNKKIGYYCYHEDENEQGMDDYLVFDS